MSRILCVAVVMAALSGPAMAGMSEGVAAVTVGDYEKAIAEFQPLASAGDAAAQYQLAKIYLEGRGPANGVPQGVELMTKAANGNYPEAQAQLGLMYAMGLGVEVDNVKAYDWLSKAVTALPAGTRRTVAEANRDAVLKRMNASQQTQVAAASKAKPAEMPAATTVAKPAATQEAAKKSATETTTAKATTPAPATTKTVTEAAATNKTTATAKPATTDTKTPEKSTQVASAKAPDAAPNAAAQQTVPSGVRIQLVSMPSEEAAWTAWKQLSGKYSSQLSGLTATVEPADLGTKGMFYRVQTGPFATVAAAQERCTAMKEAGLDCLVVGKP
ncbi:SPOR domain-containing protein [Dongia deserti]|uniref:SPOR domain-containing protein n=1 Tax=Dongia deserti TaxID=2268030 RepID=UPI000E64DCF6|nr:SPOR domain-containing protein [Dongia deserti]